MEPHLEIPGGNGHPIAIAADVLPDKSEPVQASIPGLKPVFDVASALDMIEEHERAASFAEESFALANEHAKHLRKQADALNANLRSVIRDLNTRRHEARYEAVAPENTLCEEESGSGVLSPSVPNGAELRDDLPDDALRGLSEKSIEASDAGLPRDGAFPARHPSVPNGGDSGQSTDAPELPEPAPQSAQAESSSFESPPPSSPSLRRPRSRRRAQ